MGLHSCRIAEPDAQGCRPTRGATCRTRSDIGVDLFNLFNTNYATGYNTTYVYNTDNAPRPAGWGTPTGIYAPRFVRINYTVDF
jgi:hypothetical protein